MTKEMVKVKVKFGHVGLKNGWVNGIQLNEGKKNLTIYQVQFIVRNAESFEI